MIRTAKIAELLDLDTAQVFTLAKRAKVPHITVKRADNQGKESLWKEEDIPRLVEAYRQKKEREMYKEQEREKELQEMKKKHPLVKDERCFILNWFPDPVPRCFKED